MIESAHRDDVGLRERKRLQTREALASTARLLTLDHGLNGFTVEQVCEVVGISRRTFFNYFPSKEDAVLGHSAEDLPEDLVAEFAASGRTRPRRPLLEALADLVAQLGSRMADSREDYESMSAVLHREPQLMTRLFARAESTSQQLTELIRSRERLPVEDPAPRVAIFVLGGLTRRSLDEFFASGNNLTYAQVFHRNVDALRYLFPAPSAVDISPRPPSQNQDPA